SSTAPTFMSALIVAVKVPVSSMSSRLTVLNPGSVKLREYVPGRSRSILYWPLPSVTTVRTFSMSAGLAASTVTPGSTAPDVSLTTPAMDACAYADDETIVAADKTMNATLRYRLTFLLLPRYRCENLGNRKGHHAVQPHVGDVQFFLLRIDGDRKRLLQPGLRAVDRPL